MNGQSWVLLAIFYPFIGAAGGAIMLIDDKELDYAERIAICAFWPVSLLVAICIGVGRLIGRALDALPERKPKPKSAKLPKARARP